MSPLPNWLIPTILTGSNALGNILGSRAQTNALSEARQGSSAATQQALQIIMALYDQSRNDLAPYRAVGTPALQRLVSGTGTDYGNLPRSSKTGLVQYQSAKPIAAGSSGTGSGLDLSNLPKSNTNALLQNSLLTSGQGANPLNGLNPLSVSQGNASSAAKRSGIGALVGGIGGPLALGAISSGILGAGASGALSLAGAAIPIIGPILAGVGALVGQLWNNHNPDKEFASNAINEVSKQVWGSDLKGDTDGLAYAVKTGQMPVAVGKKLFDDMWNGWIRTMQNAGVHKSIIERSVQSQEQYFRPIKDLFNSLEAKQTGGTPPPAAAPPAQAPNPLTQGQTINMTRGADGYFAPASLDTVPAMLRPGEFVMTPEATRAMGANNLNQANRYYSGYNPLQHFATGGLVVDPYETKLTPEEERAFQVWKARYAPHDSGDDYDLRGAFKAGLRPDPKTGHWPDTFKKPNHPTFSDQSIYAKFGKPGHWIGETYIPNGFDYTLPGHFATGGLVAPSPGPGFVLKDGMWIRSGAETQGVTPDYLKNVSGFGQNLSFGQSANNPLTDARVNYETQRQPGMEAFTDPHSIEAQTYAQGTATGIKDILGGQAVPNALLPAGGLQPLAATPKPINFVASPANARIATGGLNGAPVTAINGVPTAYAAPVAATKLPDRGAANPEAEYQIDSLHGANYYGPYPGPGNPGQTITQPSGGYMQAPAPKLITPTTAGPMAPYTAPPFNPLTGGGGFPGPTGAPGAVSAPAFGPGITTPGGGGGDVPNVAVPTFNSGVTGAMNPLTSAYSSGTPFDQNLPPLQVQSTLDQIVKSPGFQQEQADLNEALKNKLLAEGRWNSTYGDRQVAQANARLLGQEYQRISNENFQRSMAINDLLYGRRSDYENQQYGRGVAQEEKQYQRGQTALDRAIAQEQQQYGRGVYANETAYQRGQTQLDRALAAEQLAYGRGQYAEEKAYSRALNEDQINFARAAGVDDRDYQRALQLAQISLQAQGMSSGQGTADALAQIILSDAIRQGNLGVQSGAVSGNLANSLGSSAADWLALYNQTLARSGSAVPSGPSFFGTGGITPSGSSYTNLASQFPASGAYPYGQS